MKTYIELGLPGGRIDFLMSERNQVFVNNKRIFLQQIKLYTFLKNVFLSYHYYCIVMNLDPDPAEVSI